MDTTQATPFFTAAHREIRSYVRVGRQWRLDTWETLYAALSEVGVEFSGAAPRSAMYYAVIAEIAAEYLGEKPKQNRFRLLHRRLVFDLEQVRSTLAHMDAFRFGNARLSSDQRQKVLSGKFSGSAFSEGDVVLMREAIHRCFLVRDRMSQYCPDTS